MWTKDTVAVLVKFICTNVVLSRLAQFQIGFFDPVPSSPDRFCSFPFAVVRFCSILSASFQFT